MLTEHEFFKYVLTKKEKRVVIKRTFLETQRLAFIEGIIKDLIGKRERWLMEAESDIIKDTCELLINELNGIA